MNAPHNFLASLASSTVVERIGWLLVHSLWQFALVACLALAVQRAMRRCSAAARYLTLTAAMLLMVIAPICTWCLIPADGSDLSVAGRATGTQGHAPLVTGGGESASVGVGAMPWTGNGFEPDVANTDPSHGAEAAPAPPLTPWWSRAAERVRPWLRTIVAAWCLGVLAFSLRLVWSWRTVRRLRTVGVAAVDHAVQQAMLRMKQRLGLRRDAQVLQSTLVNAPVVVRCFRSVILLPASLVTGMPVQQLEAILAHELAHVRRYDYLANLVQTLIETLFFYHPAVWWLSRRIRVERENCCDDLVVAASGDRVQYGRALLAIEEYRGAALALGARGGSLLARVRRLLQIEANDQPAFAGAVAGLGVLGVPIVGMILWAATLADQPTKPDDSQPKRFVAELPGVLDPSSGDDAISASGEVRGQRANDATGKRTVRSDATDRTPKPDAKRSVRIRLIDAKDASPIAGVTVEAVCWEGPRNKEVHGVATSGSDGVVTFDGLEAVRYHWRLSAQEELPYVGKWRSSNSEEAVIRLERACELVLRAVDAQTGRGIPGVKFGRERAGAELWMQVVVPDTLGAKRSVRYDFDFNPRLPPESDYETDADGYYRCLVGPATWSYTVYQYPENYKSIVPIHGRHEVEIETPSGARVEQTFRLVPQKGEGANAGDTAPNHADRSNRVLDVQGHPIAGAKLEFSKTIRHPWLETPQPLGTAVTDDQGRFAYPEQLPDSDTFYVYVNADGFLERFWRANREVFRKVEGVRQPDTLVLYRPVTVSGQIIGEDGQPLADGEIAVDYFFDDGPANINGNRVKSDAEGKFTATGVPPANIFVRFETPYRSTEDRMPTGTQPARLFVVHRQAADGERIENVVLDLRECDCVVEGAIVDHEERGVAGRWVRATFAAAKGRLDESIMVKSNEQGRFRFTGLSPGEFAIGTATPGFTQQVKAVRNQPVQVRLTTYITGRKPPQDEAVPPVWGEPNAKGLVAGLRLSPDKEAYAPGDVLRVEFVVRNPTREVQMFSHCFAKQGELSVFDQHGNSITALNYGHFSGLPYEAQYRLAPDYEAVVGSFPIGLTAQADRQTTPPNATFQVPCRAGQALTLEGNLSAEVFGRDRPGIGDARDAAFATGRRRIEIVK